MKANLEIAVRAAREAGYFLRDHKEQNNVVLSQEARDIKLKGDKEAERLIRSLLKGLPIIGEEEGGSEDLLKGQEEFWVVDPLDGTYNYFRGHPQCCVSIGLMRGMTPVLGVIYDFNTEELFIGGESIPLELNGATLKPHWAEVPGQGVLMTGFPTAYIGGKEAEFFKRVQAFKKIRMNGSAALSLAYIAVGRADAYCEEGIRLWDIAAGMALLKGVGAYIDLKPSRNGRFLSYDLLVLPHKDWL